MKVTGCLILVLASVGCGGGGGAESPPPPGMDVNAVIAQCPTPAEVAAIDRDLTLTFESDPTSGQTVCTAAQSSRDLTLPPSAGLSSDDGRPPTVV